MGQVRYDLGKLVEQQIQAITHEDQLSIVSHEATCGPVVHQASRRGGNGTKRVNMLRHN